MVSQDISLGDRVEFACNPEPRCPCVLLLDTSSSMAGERIQALSAGVKALGEDLAKDSVASRRVEIAVVTFGGEVRVAQDFVAAGEFKPPVLEASGSTPMASAIEHSLHLIEARKTRYKKIGVSYYRPWVFMVTDGQPEGESEEVVQRAAQHLHAAEQSNSVAFFAVAVEGANVKRLSQIVVRTPLELEGLNFGELFLWVSASMQSISSSQPGDHVKLPPVGWLKRIGIFIRENEGELKAVASILRTTLVGH
jgi:uncharacterized protein YegL